MNRIQWVPDPTVLKNYFLKLWVDVGLLDAAWREDPDSYIDYGDYTESHAEVAYAIRIRQTATMPVVGVSRERLHIQSGHHTIAYLRDHGAVAIQVMAPKSQAGELHRLFRASRRETVLSDEPAVVGATRP